MDALVMCGGRGSRLDAEVEKPLFEVGGRPMIDRVSDALSASRAGAVYAAVSPHTPGTRAHVDLPIVETPGEGYVADLDRALLDGRIGEPVLTVAADLPLLAPCHVDSAVERHAGGALAVCVPAALKRLLGLSVGTTFESGGREVTPAGLNVVDSGSEEVTISHDARLAVNVNRPRDAEIAEALL